MTRDAISYSYSNPAEYCSIIYFDISYSHSCGSEVKAQPSTGHILYARSYVRRDYPSEAMEIVSYCTKSGRMSREFVSGKYLSVAK